MNGASPDDKWRGLAVAVMALLPAYFSIDGLVTGETLVMSRRTSTHTGAAGIVSAIAYSLFAASLVLASVRYLNGRAKRRAILFRWAMNVALAGGVLLGVGTLVHAVQ